MTDYSRILTASALGGLLAASPVAGAVEALWGDVSANIGVVSNYYFRGVTQTDDKAAVQGESQIHLLEQLLEGKDEPERAVG